MPKTMTHHVASWHSLAAWHVSVLLVVAGIAAVVALRVLANHRTRRELLPWTLALVVAVVVLSSSVQATAMISYRNHMVEHLTAILVVAPLIAAGIRVRLSRSAATCALLGFTIVIPLYHLTRVGGWVMQRGGGHVVELVSFLVVGVWFWIPVYGENRSLTDLQRITYTFITLPVIVTTGLVLWSSDAASLNSVGMAMPGISVDQIRSGGLVMIEWGSVLMAVHLVILLSWVAYRRHEDHVPVGLKYAEV